MATRNCLRIVSYSTWPHCASLLQETVCEGVPARHETAAFLTDRKLFTEEISQRPFVSLEMTVGGLAADSVHVQSAVHIQGGAGNKPGVVGSKECRSRCYVFRFRHLS